MCPINCTVRKSLCVRLSRNPHPSSSSSSSYPLQIFIHYFNIIARALISTVVHVNRAFARWLALIIVFVHVNNDYDTSIVSFTWVNVRSYVFVVTPCSFIALTSDYKLIFFTIFVRICPPIKNDWMSWISYSHSVNCVHRYLAYSNSPYATSRNWSDREEIKNISWTVL